MSIDVEEIRHRTEGIRLKEARRKKREEATLKGFKRLADYEAWLALEALATATKEARRVRQGPAGITIRDSQGVSINNNNISSGTLRLS